MERYTPLARNYPQIEVIKPHSALIKLHVLVLDRWQWESRMGEGAGLHKNRGQIYVQEA